MSAIDVAREITGADQVNTLGFCVGGTLLASALAVMAAKGEDQVASMTLLTTMLDFSDTGEIGLLISEQSVAAREQAIGKGGVLEGKELGFVFSSLRANDLDLAIRRQQLPQGEGAARVRLAVLEQRRHQPARADVLLVCAQYVPREQPARAGQDGACATRRSTCRRSRSRPIIYASREDHIVPWRTRVREQRPARRRHDVRPRRERPHRRRDQPAEEEQAQLLDGRQAQGRRGRVAGVGDERAGQLVARLERMACALRRPTRGGSRGAGKQDSIRVIEPAPGRYVKARAG